MSKLAFLFPGQGSQFAGMGRSLAERFAAARAIFDEADSAVGFSLSGLCFDGPDEQLKLTENTQPALLTVSIAALRVLESHGYEPSVVAGHSLGEYSALVAAGVLEFRDAVRLVRKRGQCMQKAVPHGVGAMAAILKLPEGKLDGILREAAHGGEIVTAANFNSPDQIVIAGHAGAVKRASELAKAAGAKRALPLPVSGPFHCPLMKPAQDALRSELERTNFRDPKVPVINNWQARVVRSASEARVGLIEQIPNSVLWLQSMRRLPELGITECFEVGAGSVLTGLLRVILSDIKCHKFGEAADVAALPVAATAAS